MNFLGFSLCFSIVRHLCQKIGSMGSLLYVRTQITEPPCFIKSSNGNPESEIKMRGRHPKWNHKCLTKLVFISWFDVNFWQRFKIRFKIGMFQIDWHFPPCSLKKKFKKIPIFLQAKWNYSLSCQIRNSSTIKDAKRYLTLKAVF